MKKRKPREIKLTYKEKRFARKYVEMNGNGTQAALAVYDTKKYQSASRIANQVLQHERVQEEIRNIAQILDAGGITDEYLTEKAKEIIDHSVGKKTFQKDANSMIQFLYKLKQAQRTKKNLNLNIKLTGKLASASVDEAKKTLADLGAKSSKLIADLSST